MKKESIREVKDEEKKENLNFQLTDVTFDIGGQLFTFKTNELVEYKSSLLFLLMKKNENSKQPIFIDRDPSLFLDIYKFIKDGIIPNTSALLVEESKYFGIDKLSDQIDWLKYPIEELSEEDREMRETESILRRLFSYDKENPLLTDPYVNLISIFDNLPDFAPVPTPTTEDMLLESTSTFQSQPLLVASKTLFEANFNNLTQFAFRSLDWNGIFIAGGSIERTVSSSYHYGDIDIFLYGLSQIEAEEKLIHIYNILKLHRPNLIIIRSENAVTFKAEQMLTVQVITRLYKSCAEILIGFDIDSCCVGYDGNKVWCLPRFKRAITKKYNLVDVERQSLSYCSRLLKYSYRGFRVKVPGYKPDKVKKVFTRRKNLSGLALLLCYHTRQRPKDGENDSENENSYLSDYTDYLCHWVISYPCNLTQSLYNSYIAHAKKLNCVLSHDMESIIDSSSILQPNQNITPHINWITEQPGRQILGSLHPIFDNFYASAYGDVKQK